jgi:hypothetical protein
VSVILLCLVIGIANLIKVSLDAYLVDLNHFCIDKRSGHTSL